jgi:hypothetical protein
MLVFLSKPVLSLQILANLFDFISGIFIVGHCVDVHSNTCMFMHECTYQYMYTIKDKLSQRTSLRVTTCVRKVCTCNGTGCETKLQKVCCVLMK